MNSSVPNDLISQWSTLRPVYVLSTPPSSLPLWIILKKILKYFSINLKKITFKNLAQEFLNVGLYV